MKRSRVFTCFALAFILGFFTVAFGGFTGNLYKGMSYGTYVAARTLSLLVPVAFGNLSNAYRKGMLYWKQDKIDMLLVSCDSKEAVDSLREHRKMGKEVLPVGCQKESPSIFVLFEKLDSLGIYYNYFTAHVFRDGD